MEKDIKYLLSCVDHTLLKPESTWKQIKELCAEGVEFGAASVCISPCFVRRAAEYLNGALPVCTVVGFPNGCHTASTKCFEAADAIKNGASELDMVINIGLVKENRFSDVLSEIRAVREVCEGKILKVIIETCLLTREEKLEMCRVVSESGADFIKTSTGFSTGGATLKDVRLMRENCAPELKIKAAGGMKTPDDGFAFLEAGAARLGTSRIIKSIRNEELGVRN